MTIINLTTTGYTLNQISYAPDNSCFDWCTIQHIVNANNISIYAVALIGLAYCFLVAIPFFKENEALKDYADLLLYLSRVTLLIFFGYYFLVVRWGIV